MIIGNTLSVSISFLFLFFFSPVIPIFYQNICKMFVFTSIYIYGTYVGVCVTPFFFFIGVRCTAYSQYKVHACSIDSVDKIE